MTLARHGVRFESARNGAVIFARGSVVLAVVLMEDVPRHIIKDIGRKFSIPPLEFYFPDGPTEDPGPPTSL